MGRVTIGADIGQRIDATAIVVVEEVLPPAGEPEWVLPPGTAVATGEDYRQRWPVRDVAYETRAMERMLDAPYPAVAARIGAIARNVRRLRPRERLTVVIDVTGVGRPIYDLVKREVRACGAALTGASFVHGSRLKGTLGDPEVTLGKEFLVARLQVLFQNRLIRLPDGHPEAAAMLRELLEYSIKARENDGLLQFGAFSVGAHDDLVTALGLATLGVYRNSTIRSY